MWGTCIRVGPHTWMRVGVNTTCPHSEEMMEPIFLKAEYDGMKYTSSPVQYWLLPTGAESAERSEDRPLSPVYSNCFYKDQRGFSYVKSIFGGFGGGVGVG